MKLTSYNTHTAKHICNSWILHITAVLSTAAHRRTPPPNMMNSNNCGNKTKANSAKTHKKEATNSPGELINFSAFWLTAWLTYYLLTTQNHPLTALISLIAPQITNPGAKVEKIKHPLTQRHPPALFHSLSLAQHSLIRTLSLALALALS